LAGWTSGSSVEDRVPLDEGRISFMARRACL
jgi:hypothetical protein